MKKISLALIILIVVGICIPAVSAETIIDETFTIDNDTSYSHSFPRATSSHLAQNINTIRFWHIEDHNQMYYVDIVGYPHSPPWPDNNFLDEGRYETTYTLGGQTKDAVIYVTNNRNILGTIISTKFTIFFDDWDIGDLVGAQNVELGTNLFYSASTSSATSKSDTVQLYGAASQYSGVQAKYDILVTSSLTWENHLNVFLNDDKAYEITLNRNLLRSSPSEITGYHDGNIVFTNHSGTDFSTVIGQAQINMINISPGSQIFTFSRSLDIGGEAPPDDSDTAVTIYIRNSQTYALIANAHINISASVNGTLHEVVNKTAPSGIYSIDLQPTGGGKPNPDFYRLIVTAEGYNSIMPHIDFEVDGATSIYAYLDPTGGAPEDENNTFIDFFVRDVSANPISGATVNFGGYTLITNSAGYTIFEVDKSKTYTWTVSKSGYGSLTGNAVIGDDPRHTINTVLAPAVTPTTPTSIPTSTPISSTPTMTAPTGEPVSNWLEWFAAHFGMILGGGAEIGKIFMWLCFAVPVGVYVGKESKAGAAGFMAGAGIVTLFFVLIGWVPIWLLVFLALIIGLLYAKVFNNSDNGGGR